MSRYHSIAVRHCGVFWRELSRDAGTRDGEHGMPKYMELMMSYFLLGSSISSPHLLVTQSLQCEFKYVLLHESARSICSSKGSNFTRKLLLGFLADCLARLVYTATSQSFVRGLPALSTIHITMQSFSDIRGVIVKSGWPSGVVPVQGCCHKVGR